MEVIHRPPQFGVVAEATLTLIALRSFNEPPAVSMSKETTRGGSSKLPSSFLEIP